MRRAAAPIAVGLLFCLAGGGFGAPPLYVAGIGLVLVGTAATIWVDGAARRARVIRSVGRSVVEEQAPLPITVSVVRGRIPLPGGGLRAWPGDSARPVPAATQATVATVVRFARRGRHRLGPASLMIADPLGLRTRTLTTASEELLVLPRIEPVRTIDAGAEASALARQVLSTPDAGTGDVDSLRPHRPGTPASRIHWPTVARTRNLMERSLTTDHAGGPVVVVDPRAPSSPEALDQAVRAAASLCAHLARHGGCALLLPGDRSPVQIDRGLRVFADAHSRLALLAPEDGPPQLGGLTSASAVLWVTAARVTAPPPGTLPAQTWYLISPHPRAGQPVHFTVAGCSGQLLAVDPASAKLPRAAA